MSRHRAIPAKRVLNDALHAPEPDEDDYDEAPHFDGYFGQPDNEPEDGYEVDAAGTFTG